MTTFRYGDISVECRSESTRSGFRHIAVLFDGYREIDRAKCCYLNRTWERFEFESVLHKLRDKNELLKVAMIEEKI